MSNPIIIVIASYIFFYISVCYSELFYNIFIPGAVDDFLLLKNDGFL